MFEFCRVEEQNWEADFRSLSPGTALVALNHWFTEMQVTSHFCSHIIVINLEVINQLTASDKPMLFTSSGPMISCAIYLFRSNTE